MYGPPLSCKRKEKDVGSAQMYSVFCGATLRTKMESARFCPHYLVGLEELYPHQVSKAPDRPLCISCFRQQTWQETKFDNC
jgi:hypothetical protein